MDEDPPGVSSFSRRWPAPDLPETREWKCLKLTDASKKRSSNVVSSSLALRFDLLFSLWHFLLSQRLLPIRHGARFSIVLTCAAFVNWKFSFKNEWQVWKLEFEFHILKIWYLNWNFKFWKFEKWKMQKFIFQNLKFTWPNLYTDSIHGFRILFWLFFEIRADTSACSAGSKTKDLGD